jgi:hypothetical protein
VLLAFVLMFGGAVLLTQRTGNSEMHVRDVLMHTAVGAVTPGDGDRAPTASASNPGTQHTTAYRRTTPETLAANRPATPPVPAPPETATAAPARSAPIAEPPAPASTPTLAVRPPQPTAAAPAIAQQPLVSAPRSRRSAQFAQPPSLNAIGRAHAPFAPVAPAYASQHKEGVERELAVASADMQKSDLTSAHAALARALVKEPANSEAFMLRQDLHSREQARDAALNVARGCAAQHLWHCAWQNAGNALSIDTSSLEARSMVQRSIVDSGAISEPPGPGPDMPDGP